LHYRGRAYHCRRPGGGWRGLLEPRAAEIHFFGRSCRVGPWSRNTGRRSRLKAVRQIDAIFAIEREINGMPAEQRLAVRTTRIAPLVSELESWMRGEWARLFRHARQSHGLHCSAA
jgi:hypothetical protein